MIPLLNHHLGWLLGGKGRDIICPDKYNNPYMNEWTPNICIYTIIPLRYRIPASGLDQPSCNGSAHTEIRMSFLNWMSWLHLGVEPKIGVVNPPKWMVKIMENPMNKWMIWGETPLFLETAIWANYYNS